MPPIAIRGLDHQVIRRSKLSRRLHDRIVLAANVSREGDRRFAEPESQAGRTDDVPRPREGGRNSRSRRETLVEGLCRELWQASLGVLARVERLGSLMPRVAVLVRASSVLLLEESGVG
jgi:hypothetical protein